MLPRVYSSDQTKPTYDTSAASSSRFTSSPCAPLTPSALSGTLLTLQGHLCTLEQHEGELDQIKTRYFQALPELYPIPSEGGNPAQLDLHGALAQRQQVMEKIGVARTHLHAHSQQIKSTRQHIRDVHMHIYNAIMLNQSVVRKESRKTLRESAKLEQKALRLQRRCEQLKGAFAESAQLSELPEIAHAARCVDLMLPKKPLDTAEWAKHPTDSPLLKTLFGLSRLWMGQAWPVSSPKLAQLLQPDARLVEGLASKAGLTQPAIRLLMQLAGLNAVMHANQGESDLAAKVQSGVRAVLGRSIVSLFVANRHRRFNLFEQFDKKYSEWFFPILDQKKMKFIDSALSALEPQPYFEGLLAGLSRYMAQACRQSSPLQPVLNQFNSALDSTVKAAQPDALFGLVEYCANVSFPSMAEMKHPFHREQEAREAHSLRQSALGQSIAQHLGVEVGAYTDGGANTSKENHDYIRRWYFDYNPTPEQPYANADTQEFLNNTLGLLKQEMVPIKQVIDLKSVPMEELSVELTRHSLGAMDYQRACLPLAQQCFSALEAHQQQALNLSALEHALAEVEHTVQHCVQGQLNQTKARQSWADLQRAEHELNTAHQALFAELIDGEKSPLLPLFVHRSAFQAFVNKHVNISKESLKQRALAHGQTASRYNKAEGLLRAVLEVYELVNLPQYGGPTQQAVMDDEVSHAKPIGLSMVVRDGKCIQAKADTSVFSLVRESVNQAWRIAHLYPK